MDLIPEKKRRGLAVRVLGSFTEEDQGIAGGINWAQGGKKK